MVAQNTPPFPFFVGAPRSGTTLFRAIFDFHPDMAIPDESNFVPMLGRVRARYERPHGFATSPLLDDLFAQRSFRRWGLSRNYVEGVFQTDPPVDYPQAVRILYGLYARRQNKTRYADKTPQYVMDISLLADLFPESRFVHIIRDGRDVALSVLDVDFGARSTGAAALSWRDFVNRGRESGARLAGRYCEVRYEDILEAPESNLASLCDFLDLSFDPAMLRYFESSEKITSPAAWSRRHVLLPPTKGLRDWRTQMPKKDVAVFEALSGDLLEDLGYERTSRQAPVAIRMQSRAAVLGRHVRGLSRRARRFAIDRKPKQPGPPDRLFPHPRGDGRQEAVAFLLAEEAAKDRHLISFREHTLGGRLLLLEQVPSWVTEQANRDGDGARVGGLEYLGADPWPLSRPTVAGGTLEHLRSLGARLADTYGWEQCQASTFVLTGLTPRMAAIRSAMVGGVPLSSTTRVVLEVDPIATPRDLMKHYKRVRARTAPRGLWGTTKKDRRLAVFVAERPDMSWPDLMRLWNEEFGDWSYADATLFQRDAVSARRGLVDPR